MARTTSAKATSGKPSKRVNRRSELRRNLPKPAFDYRSIIGRPEFVTATAILLCFVFVVATILNWSRGQVRVRDGQIMNETKLRRLTYQQPDDNATKQAREQARKDAPRVYRPNDSYLGRLQQALIGLPKAVAGKTELEEISDEIRTSFNLKEPALLALQGQLVEDNPSADWQQAVDCLIENLVSEQPLLTSDEYQRYSITENRALMRSDGKIADYASRPIELLEDAPLPEQRLRSMIEPCGFPVEVLPSVLAWIASTSEPTLLYDEEKTEEEAAKAAEAIEPVMDDNERGTLLYKRGDVLTAEQYLQVVQEADAFAVRSGLLQNWVPRLGIVGLVLLMTTLLAGFGAMNYPRLARNSIRIAAVCSLMIIMLAAATLVTARAPTFLYAAGLGPTLFAVVLVLLAYDQRLAAVIGAMQAILVTIALEQSVGWFVLSLVACGAMIAQLREVRHRSSLIRAAVVTAGITAIGAVMLGLYEVPLRTPGAWQQVFANAGLAGAACFSVGFLVLGILPSIERLLDITTGMTLAELRDPKQPLLRQLQQKAPGTYNHSLQVANICEAAAEAIGANGLLIYVGALYHDIGKLNKPEYFIENQADGYNKHDKLSPAMSLLVIIGHVKDGVELAREYNLPRSLIHFIESHHGTTLVEYFYHAAKTQAEADEKGSIDEVVFRYPGPKPRTKEAAILMLSDAVESATRAMAEPNPSRIESLVREISAKRLADGQFDQCPLTFRELGLIEEAIISRLCAIHHGRISYPSKESDEQATPPATGQVKPAAG